MKKKKVKNLLWESKLLYIFFLILLTNCEKENLIHVKDEVTVLQNPLPFKTVSVEKSKDFFKRPKQSGIKARLEILQLEPDLEAITQEELTNVDELVTVIPAKTKFKNIETRILQVEDNEGNIQSLLFNEAPDTTSSEDNFTGYTSVTTIDGVILEAYRIENNVTISEFVYSDSNIVPMASDCDESLVPDSSFCNNMLEEVVIGSSTSDSSPLNYNIPCTSGSIAYCNIQWRYNNNSYYSYAQGYMNYLNYLRSQPCGSTNQVRDFFGVCVDRIKNNLTNTCANDIFEELQNNLYTEDPLKPEITIPNSNITELNFSELILKLFNDSNSTNLIIENNDIGDANAHTIGATITLNNSYIEATTQLSIARTIIHESLHAYLNALYSNVIEFNSFTFREKMDRYASDNGYVIGSNTFHHEFMGQYVNAMAYSLYAWDKNYGTGGNLGWNYYYSMAFGGLFQTYPDGKIATETETFKSIIPDPIERQKIADIIFNELKNNNYAKGSDCN